MSVENSVTRGGREAEQQAEQSGGFQLPPELAKRYEVRIIPANDTAERRIGMFLPGDRDNPSIEISGNGDRIVARREDPETVAALVQIAKHNGWEGIDVDGSPEFRKAVWTAGTREGLTVHGYEPEFGEQARMDELRRDDAARREREAGMKAPAEQTAPAATVAVAEPAVTVRSADAERDGGAPARQASSAGLSSDDQRLLLTVSAYTQDRKVLEEGVRPDMPAMERQFQHERLDFNRDALNGALDRALESETLVSAFYKSGYEPDDLRKMARGGEWDGQVADAIYLVRSGLHRDTLERPEPAQETEAARFRVDRWDPATKEHVVLGETNSPAEAARLFNRETDTRLVDQQEGRTVGHTEWVNDGSFPRWRLEPAMEQLIAREAGSRESAPDASRSSPAEPALAGREPQHTSAAAPRRSESEELAELFLHGGAERISAEPRLANALEAQAMMEKHLEKVFDGDVWQTTAATLESRQMISDVLRRGLDVSVREPTPVRQVKPLQPTPDMER